MHDLRERRREEGLVKVEVYIRPEYKKRLSGYVKHRLFGQCDVRITKRKRKDEKQVELSFE